MKYETYRFIGIVIGIFAITFIIACCALRTCVTKEEAESKEATMPMDATQASSEEGNAKLKKLIAEIESSVKDIEKALEKAKEKNDG